MVVVEYRLLFVAVYGLSSLNVIDLACVVCVSHGRGPLSRPRKSPLLVRNLRSR